MLNPDYIPPYIGVPAALILIAILFVMVLRDRRKNRKRALPQKSYRPPQGLYDQDEDLRLLTIVPRRASKSSHITTRKQ